MELVNEGTKVSRNSQLYLEHQTVYALRLKRSHMSKVCNHKGKPQKADRQHVAGTCFPKRHINKYQQSVVVNNLK